MSRTLDPPAAPTRRPLAPGVRQLLPLPYGHMARSLRDPLAFMSDGRRRFGDVFRHQLGPFAFNLVSHPDGVRHVLQDNYKNYPRSWLYRFTRVVAGDGLVATEGDVWRRQRRMVQPAFNPQRVAALARPMTDAAAAMLDRWDRARHAETGTPFDVAAEMIALTLRIVGATLLGVELGGATDRIGPAVATALAYLDHRIRRLVSPPLWLPTPRNRRFRDAMRTLDGVVYDIIATRRRTGEDAGDLLAMLLQVRDEETGQGMTDRELRDQVTTFIGAGHETTAVLLAWVWYLLSQHPDAERRVREEVGHVLAGRVPTFDDLPALRVTRMVIQEALRLYPPVYALARDVAADDEIGGYRIPRGSIVVLSQYITHRHPDVWADPERFDPDRFTPERIAARPRFAWFPFLGGPHQCVGQDFAIMEATLIVAMVVQRYRLALAPGAKVEPKSMLSLRPAGGLPMIASRA